MQGFSCRVSGHALLIQGAAITNKVWGRGSRSLTTSGCRVRVFKRWEAWANGWDVLTASPPGLKD